MKSEWTLNQKQFDQNKSQEISHISPQEHLNVFNREETSVSYLQLPVKNKEENHFLPGVVKQDIGDDTAKCQHGANFAHRRHMLHKPAENMKNL